MRRLSSSGKLAVRRSTWALALVVALAGADAPSAQSFCELAFKDVAEHAPIVALAEYRNPKGQVPHLRVLEVVKGESQRGILGLGPHGLRVYSPVRGDQFLLALTEDHTLVKSVRGTGFCSPISVLVIRNGKLRARDRTAYDGRRKTMTLDELRAEINGRTAPASGGSSRSNRDRAAAGSSQQSAAGQPQRSRPGHHEE